MRQSRERILSLIAPYFFGTVLCPPLLSFPLPFEQRSPNLYQARFAAGVVVIRPGYLIIGGTTLRFEHASSAVQLEGVGNPSPATYIVGSTSRTFRQFPEVVMRHLYAGVDVVFYGNGEHLEYDLRLSPGADLHHLRLRFEGSRKVQLEAGGCLQIKSSSGNVMQLSPRAFQSDGQKVTATYVLLSQNRVGFHIGPHDRRLALTIDPELVFSKDFGGGGTDVANVIAADSLGNIYIGGTSNSVDFPITAGSQPKQAAPMVALSGGGTAITPLPVSNETSVLGIGGTSDGNVIYAVTPDAVYVSSNHGIAWTQNASFPMAASAGGFQIFNVSVDAIDPARVFVATNRGLYFSSQGGQSWSLYGYGLPIGPSGFVNITSVLVSPVDHAILYAVTAAPVGVYKSSDAGNSWTALNPTYPGKPASAPSLNYVIALGANGRDVYLVDPYGTALKSTDGGASWQQFGPSLYAATSILIDPMNASNIYVSDYSGIEKSSDGGATFTLLTTYPGGSGIGQHIALDASSGSLYLGGTNSPIYAISTSGGTLKPLPVSTPNLHALIALGGQVYAGFDTPSMPYVIKWNSTGTNILYSTFFGGTRQDVVTGLAVDGEGNATVAGYTYSPDFPVTTKLSSASAGFSAPSGFVSRLSADGTRLIYSALLGGSTGSTATFIQAIALDSSGAAYVTGQTAASDFPLSSNAFQAARPLSKCNRPQTAFLVFPDLGVYAFVSKISPDGSQLVYSTLVTGSCGSVGQGIAVNDIGEATVVGSTTSTDFPATPGAYQPVFPGPPNATAPPNALYAGFASRLSAAGDRILASTYVGGSYSTLAKAVALDSARNIYLTGFTAKILPGATPGAYQNAVADRCVIPIGIGPTPPYGGTNDAFVLKLDSTVSTAAYLTYLGGGCDDGGTGIALDSSGNAWIAGYTNSSDFPLKSPFQGAGVSGRIVSELSADGSQLLFSSSTGGVSLVIDPLGGVDMAGSATASAVTKRIQTFGGYGTAAEWIKIDPAAIPPIIIDNVQPVSAYPPTPLIPSSLGNGVAPGELVRITGHNLGPAAQVDAQLDSTGRLPFTLAGTTILFDNVPAPIISAGATAVICFAPFEISQSTNVTITQQGRRSNSVRVGVTLSDIQILAVGNQNGSLNSLDQPAKPGDVLTFYVSGLGQTKPLSADGLTNTAPLPVPVASVMVYSPSMPIQPDFIGAAPGQTAGIVQINVRLPAQSYSSNLIRIGLNNASAPVYVSQ